MTRETGGDDVMWCDYINYHFKLRLAHLSCLSKSPEHVRGFCGYRAD
ncbi:hypothetical protein [Moraxella lacunata]